MLLHLVQQIVPPHSILRLPQAPALEHLAEQLQFVKEIPQLFLQMDQQEELGLPQTQQLQPSMLRVW